MRLTCSTKFKENFVAAGRGTSIDSPIEDQRVYAAIVQGTVTTDHWSRQEVVEFDAYLNDADVAFRSFLAERPPWVDRDTVKNHVDRIERRAMRMKRRVSAYAGKLSPTQGGIQAWHAFRAAPLSDSDWPYYPVASLCPGGALEEGELWPCSIAGHRIAARYVAWQFIPLGSDPQAAGALLTIRPYRQHPGSYR